MLGSLKLTVQEAIRYRGRSGHYSWIAHRLTGLGILAFFIIHIWDTANARFWPEGYIWTIEFFKHPFWGVSEVGLMGAVLYHAFNGIRITILDFKPELWRLQARSATLVWLLFLLIFIPIAIYQVNDLIAFCGNGGAPWADSCWQWPPFSIARLP